MMSQKTASQPLTARMNLGSPCTDAHNERITLTSPSSMKNRRSLMALGRGVGVFGREPGSSLSCELSGPLAGTRRLASVDVELHSAVVGEADKRHVREVELDVAVTG